MDSSLKQRLIGAVVLIALAVIFLPMLIKGPAPDSGVSDVSMRVPDAPADDFVEIPLGPVGELPQGGAVGLDPSAPATVTATPATDAVATPGAQAPMLPAATAAGDYAVSFGAYATTSDADAVVARLKQSQLPGFRVADTLNGKTVYRVRIGPYADRAEAEVVRLQAVKVRSDVNAQVIALDAEPESPPASPQVAVAATEAPAVKSEPPKPAAAAPATAAPPKPAPEPARSTATVGFAVQLGAFASASDANALRDRVRGAGFSAFVEPVRTDKGTLQRVRVGPVASRDEAEKLKAQIAAKTGIAGMVRSHP
ncbi:sporulation protein [Pseudoxanthomonas kalamensis DSM 18571]|uniref:SPOR domain-containing protein n=1 Tax=Pseudoxanthomonas kalamensis TaxID=289483 RepID=UPI001391E3FD|nr:SPOR domain-containing protein [Pseudoxanthomonas kalamensis]KAF1709393.1 sporulation protein [Pseudoxanthomonas kalamensis DSM 18571]